MIVISFKVDQELAKTIEKYIKEKNITKSELIRKALEMYLNKDLKKPFKTKRITIY